jgi:hypothetical protein
MLCPIRIGEPRTCEDQHCAKGESAKKAENDIVPPTEDRTILHSIERERHLARFSMDSAQVITPRKRLDGNN